MKRISRKTLNAKKRTTEDNSVMQEYWEVIKKAEHDAKTLFTAIADTLTPDDARRIFTDVLKRQPGRRQTWREQNIDGFLIALYDAGATNIRNLAEWAHRQRKVHSIEAGEKRIQRLLRKRHTRDK